MPSPPQQDPYRGIAPLGAPGPKMSAREYELWRDENTWDPSRHSRLVIQTDLRPADWIEPVLPACQSSAPVLLPLGYDAYARIFLPCSAETADERRERIAESLDEPMPGIDRDAQVDSCRFLPPGQFEGLLPILARHASSPISWFLLWDGFGNLNERVFGQAPKVRHPLRNQYLLRGPHEAYHDLPHEPNYWWPDDRAWCVCADTDWDYHYIAGTVACIGEILRACDGS